MSAMLSVSVANKRELITMSARAVSTKPSAVSADDLRQLHQTYDLRNPVEIEPYLAEHPELVALLIEGRRQIDRYFTADVPVTLSLDTDPEDGDQALYAWIITGLPGEESDARLVRFWHEWWFKQKPSGPQLLFFDAL